MPKRNPYITRGMHSVLTELRDDPEYSDAIVFEKGQGWWVGVRQTNGATVVGLIRLGLLQPDPHNTDTFQRYEPNSETFRVLDSVGYVPVMILALKQKGEYDALQCIKHLRRTDLLSPPEKKPKRRKTAMAGRR